MRYPAYFLAFVAFITTFSVQSNTLSQELDTLIQQTLPHANVGVLIKDAQTGQILYELNAHKFFNSASNIKLFTAAAALYQLGPNYQYVTSLSQDQNNFYLTFSGSPSLTIEQLKQLILHLKELGIKEIAGNFVLDISRFKPPYYAAGISYDDLGWYYAAPSSAVILNGNAVAYDFISAPKLGMPIQIEPKTPDKSLTLINEVVTVSKTQEKNHCGLNIEIKNNNTLRLYGCLSQEEHPRKMQLAIPNPTLLAKQIIKKTLEENDIQLKGAIITGNTPAHAKVIASHESENLTRLLTHMLEESDNLYADSLTKLLAYTLTQQGTYKQGAYAIKTILAQHTKLDVNQLELTDGVGTRYNLQTPAQIVMLLTDLYNDEKMKPIFLSTLPRAGASGTLKGRMKNTYLEKNVLAKTGSMHDISALSGYLTTRKGRTLIFSIISNDIIKNINLARQLEEKILLLTATKVDEQTSTL